MHKPYKEALGDDLVLVPLPDYGTGSRTSQGGWQWTITKAAGDPDAAWKWIEYTLQPENMTPYAAANSAPASRTSVLEADPLYREGGDLHLLVSQLGDGSSVARPPHPSYATVSSAYREAVQEIIDGADVQGALDKAAKTIDDDLEDNEFYPAPE
jgi:multiple sugar transport system substrate-binding protein